MGKRREIEIRVESYVYVGDQLVNTRDLTHEQKVQLAGWIKLTYCQALYRGKAVFSLVKDEQTDMDRAGLCGGGGA